MMMYSDRETVEKIEEFLEDTTLEEFLADNDLTVPEALLLLWQEGHVNAPFWEKTEDKEEESDC